MRVGGGLRPLLLITADINVSATTVDNSIVQYSTLKYKLGARTLGARSGGSKISDPSVLATRVAYVFIFYLCCLFSVCNVFTTPRAGP